MLPGLREFLESVPADKRHGWIANPYPIKRIVPRDATWIRPCAEDLEALAKAYTNRAIGRAFGVSDTTVRGWLDQECISRKAQFYRGTPEIPDELPTKCGAEVPSFVVGRPELRFLA